MPTSPEHDQPDAFNFAGFARPNSNFFRLPNDWTDISARITKIAELKVVEYILRHTWGYQEYGIKKCITIDEFMHGRKRQDGTRMDGGTGLSKQSVITGLQDALAHGLIEEEVDDSDRARIKKWYSLKMREGDDFDNEDLDVKNLDIGVQTLDSRGPSFRHRTEKDTLERNLKKDTYPSKNRNSQKEGKRYVNQCASEQSERLPASKGEDERRRGRVEQARFYEVDYDEAEDEEKLASKRRNTTTKNEQTPAARGGGFEAVGATVVRTRGSHGRGRAVDEDRQYFVDLWEEFGNELNDQAEMSSSVSQLVNIFRAWHTRTGGNRDGFLQLLYEARSRTKERSGAIRLKEQREGYAAKNRVPYFFATLRDLTGLREEPQDGRERAD